ncbi:PREDICTED: uncharacterized protein LOC108376369 [Rhagoletis zephyria]|uniref:uncharacterized protein LOC108376369 n=1 Tax=Rhagoletis zephyria TaxID=28612 RepID=UPI00081139D8|nr:PREDICTED: uncharacterized protein LOC108376369 [Rhagoletis zephyria]
MDLVYRATCRTQLTKLCNAAEGQLRAAAEGEVDNLVDALNNYLERIKNVHEKLKRVDEATLAVLGDDEKERELETVFEYDDKAVSIIAKLEFKLQRLSAADSRKIQESANGGEHADYRGAKLKPMELKKFDGKLENWLLFWEQYKHAIHENPKLDVASKFNYLCEALVGKAASTIAGFMPTENCYKDAIQLLLEEYGDKDKMIEKYIQKILSVKMVHSASDVKGLRFLYNETTSTMRSLTALEVPSSQYNIMVNSVLLKAIPAELRIEFHKSKGRASNKLLNSTVIDKEQESAVDSEQITKLLEFIKLEVEALEKARSRKQKERRRA